EDRAPLDRSPSGDDTIGVRLLLLQAEAGRPVPAQLLDLPERPLVQQECDALMRRQLALGVLSLGRAVTGTAPRHLAERLKFGHPSSDVGRIAGGLLHYCHVPTLRTSAAPRSVDSTQSRAPIPGEPGQITARHVGTGQSGAGSPCGYPIERR